MLTYAYVDISYLFKSPLILLLFHTYQGNEQRQNYVVLVYVNEFIALGICVFTSRCIYFPDGIAIRRPIAFD